MRLTSSCVACVSVIRERGVVDHRKRTARPDRGRVRIAARQVTYGKTPPEAVTALANRVDLPDVRFFAVAVQIHHEAGGNLAEILSASQKSFRSRFQLFRKVHALTVEGRFSAWFLSIFPVGMAFVMNGMQPGYYEKVSDFPISSISSLSPSSC